MLVLRRKKGEAVAIGGGILVRVLEIEKDRVKLGFVAPPEVVIAREELPRSTLPEQSEATQPLHTQTSPSCDEPLSPYHLLPSYSHSAAGEDQRNTLENRAPHFAECPLPKDA